MTKNRKKPKSFVKSKKSRKKTYKQMNENRNTLKSCN